LPPERPSIETPGSSIGSDNFDGRHERIVQSKAVAEEGGEPLAGFEKRVRTRSVSEGSSNCGNG
jgi:hypothetical protein